MRKTSIYVVVGGVHGNGNSHGNSHGNSIQDGNGTIFLAINGNGNGNNVMGMRMVRVRFARDEYFLPSFIQIHPLSTQLKLTKGLTSH